MSTENSYSTTDFGFSCYLLTNNIDIVEVILKDRDRGICEFIFLISKEDEFFQDMENKWYNSNDTKAIKDILRASRILKGKLKICLLQNNAPRKI